MNNPNDEEILGKIYDSLPKREKLLICLVVQGRISIDEYKILTTNINKGGLNEQMR